MPWQAGVQISWRHVILSLFCGTNMRDHDCGKEIESEAYSKYPYMFLDQLVYSAFGLI